jgi:hypothetical protein
MPRAARDSAALPKPQYVAVVFKERRYDGSHKTWFFANIDHVAIVNGRLQLTRDDYGLVFDTPYEEVEQVCAEDLETSAHMTCAEA